MKLKLFYNKSTQDNAAHYYEQAKKQKAKINGVLKTIETYQKKLEKLNKIELAKPVQEKIISSEGLLCIGGRDATTNEVIIKKHLEQNDLVFHTDMPGSPFFVIKNPDNKEIGQETITQTAEATASYSKAWKAGLTTAEVFYVKPDQVSKQAQSGEYLTKGSFMIRGKRTNLKPLLNIAIGKTDKIIGGPLEAIKHQTKLYVKVTIGTEKPGAIAKKIAKKLNTDELDDIIRFLPAGGVTMNG
jgi:predicted ribosome quality control (RQC) complex YloA/Tae2 family protein